jgi:SOS-response transcriptional repressor LexA
MLITARVNVMATNTRKHPKPEYGLRLERRRRQVRKSMDRIDEETDGKLYKQWLYRLENGYKQPDTLTLEEVALLADALEWSPEQLIEALGLDIPIIPSSDVSFSIGDQLLGELVLLPLVGEVGAGYGTSESEQDVVEMIPIPLSFLEGSKPENCRLRRVTGDSMACEDVQREIPDGATVIYDVTLEPVTGDIVLCRVWEGDVPYVVLKVWDDSKSWVELRSYNEEHPPIILSKGMRCEKIGVYINHLGLGRKERRRR